MDILDKIPQLGQADSNHVVYGGLLGFVLLLAGLLAGLDPRKAALIALGLVSLVVVVKKIYDRLYELESIEICIWKIFLTVLWPASLLLVLVMAHS